MADIPGPQQVIPYELSVQYLQRGFLAQEIRGQEFQLFLNGKCIVNTPQRPNREAAVIVFNKMIIYTNEIWEAGYKRACADIYNKVKDGVCRSN